MTFIRYMRDEDGRPFGCVVAVVDLPAWKVTLPIWGASLCNPRDRFSRKRARDIALGRAFKLRGDRLSVFRSSLPQSREIALENAVRLIEADIGGRDRWLAEHPR